MCHLCVLTGSLLLSNYDTLIHALLPADSHDKRFRSSDQGSHRYLRMWPWWISSTLCFLQARQQSSKAIQVSVQSHPVILLQDVIVVDFINLVFLASQATVVKGNSGLCAVTSHCIT